MTKLSEAITKKSSKLLLTRDLVGKVCMITEDLTPNTELRQTEDGKYFAIQIQRDGEIRDWNPTPPQLREVVVALGNPANLKGKKFQVTGSVKDGYKSKTTVAEYREGVSAEERQTRVRDYSNPTGTSPNNIPVDEKARAISCVLTYMKGASLGIHDSRFEDFVRDSLQMDGIVGSVSQVMAGVKTSGKVVKTEADLWKVVS